MSKVIYTSEPAGFDWRHVLPWLIIKDLWRHRLYISSMTIQNFRAAYQGSYFGVTWQILLPIIMFSIFYFVFGQIFGGRFLNNGKESAIDYALALFVGLGLFNFFAQNLGSAPSIITSNSTYVKTLAFPLEVFPLVSVLNAVINLIIGMLLTAVVIFIVKGEIYASAIMVPFYILSIFLMAVGFSYALAALAVFIRDVSAVISPLTLILMFLCPIFYPASMIPAKIKWIINLNPLALIIEDMRGCFLYGIWPSIESVLGIGAVSIFFAIMGYFFFMRSKAAFADVI